MVDALPGMPGEVPTSSAYRGDPWSQTFQFVDQDTTDWVCDAQVRRHANDEPVLATITVETNFEGDPEIVRLSLDEDQTADLPPRILPWDLEKRDAVGEPPRTMLVSAIDLSPDVTRVETGS